MKTIFLLLFLFGPGSVVFSAAIPLEFTDPLQEQRYNDLIKELRCLVCQNQSLADSNADLAQDLREEVYRLIIGGADNNETVAFLVDRYGEFVRYRPPFNLTTLLLWLGPIILLMLAGFVAVRVVRGHGRQTVSELGVEEQQRAALLLQVKNEVGERSC